ncbi:hypothetical protein HDK77DRAFT_106203 [Phyllosticta capitalensis]
MLTVVAVVGALFHVAPRASVPCPCRDRCRQTSERFGLRGASRCMFPVLDVGVPGSAHWLSTRQQKARFHPCEGHCILQPGQAHGTEPVVGKPLKSFRHVAGASRVFDPSIPAPEIVDVLLGAGDARVHVHVMFLQLLPGGSIASDTFGRQGTRSPAFQF